jgi:hypothetical protein
MVTKVNTQPDTPPADPPAPGVESLDAIAAAGAQLDTPQADPKAEQQVLASEAEELAGALKMLRAAALPFAPEHVQDPLGQVWSDRQLVEIGKAIVAVCRMHGLTVGQLFEGYGPYIQLVMALGMPALATLKLLKTPPPKVERADGQHQPT